MGNIKSSTVISFLFKKHLFCSSTTSLRSPFVAAKCSDRTRAGFCPGGQAPHPRPSPAPKPRPAPLAPPHGNLTGRKHLRWYAGSPTRLEPLLLGTNPERLLNTSHPLAEITGAV